VQAVDLPALGCAARAASRIGARLVYDSHELWSGFLANPELELPAWRRHLMMRAERIYAPRADAVFVVSDEMGRRMARRYSLNRVTTVFNAPPGRAAGSRPTMSPVRLVFHGSLAKTKNVEGLVLAMTHLRGRATLAVHGASYTMTEDRLLQLVRENGLEDTVSVHGGFRYDDVLEMLAPYDVDVYAAQMLEENFAISLPNKVFDAICAGLAVAASDFPAIRELLTECGCGVCIDPASPESIAASLGPIIDDPATIDAMKAASVASASACGWEAQGRKVVGVLEEITAHRSGGPTISVERG
jgi:glycosyltransferase involved in cell wall biosynthesis